MQIRLKAAGRFTFADSGGGGNFRQGDLLRITALYFAQHFLSTYLQQLFIFLRRDQRNFSDM